MVKESGMVSNFKEGECQCGCKGITGFRKGKRNKFIFGHHNKGINNPMYGKYTWNKDKKCPQISISKTGKYNGDKSPFWKGGRPKCNICGKPLSSYKSKYCMKHRNTKGELNPRWKGGKSFEPYCPKFTASLKEEIRNKYNRQCFLCEKSEKDNKRKLDVHHVDYDKEQGCGEKKWELVPLCKSCHTATNNSREKYMNLIRRKLNEDTNQ